MTGLALLSFFQTVYKTILIFSMTDCYFPSEKYSIIAEINSNSGGNRYAICGTFSRVRVSTPTATIVNPTMPIETLSLTLFRNFISRKNSITKIYKSGISVL